MSIASTTTAAYAIRDQFMPGFVRGVWRNGRLLRVMRAIGAFGAGGLREPNPASVAGTGLKWHINHTGNSVETFTEHSAIGVEGSQGYNQASLGFVSHRGVFGMTGFAVDALKDGGEFPAGFDTEQQLLVEDIANAVNDTYLGSGANGIQTMISDTSTYAGIARGSAAYWESTQDDTSAAQTIAKHKSVYRSMRDAEKGGLLTLNLTSPTQADTYSSLVGSSTTVNTPQVTALLQSLAGAAAYDVGVVVNGQTLHNAPIIEMPDLANTLWLYLDTTERSGWFHRVIRPYKTKWLRNEADSELFVTSVRSQLGVMNPMLSAKRTALT